MYEKFIRKVVSILKKYEFILQNLDCANCANKIQAKIASNEQFKNVVVNFSTLKLTYEAENENRQMIEQIVKSLEPEVEVVKPKEKSAQTVEKGKLGWGRLLLGTGIMAIGTCIQMPTMVARILVFLAYAILLYRTIGNAVKLLKTSKTINENFLVTMSCFGAFLIGEQWEGFMVIMLYEIGKILEEKAVHKTRKSISDLMNIKPEYANVKTNQGTNKTEPENVKVGDIVIIKQGEKIPLDGIVVEGEADLDVASLTGESALKNVKVGSEVLSGSINTQGLLEIRVTQEYKNSTVSRILELVENATDKKAKTETFVNQAAKIYTPIVIVLAILVGLCLPGITNISYTGKNGSIYRALIFLVVSCPCAIAISVPLSYFSGIGKASKKGILIKGSDYLDAFKQIKQIVFDKTGTLTKGEFSIQQIQVYQENYTQEQVLEYAVLGESFSNHPIAFSLKKAYGKEIEEDKIKDFKDPKGKRVRSVELRRPYSQRICKQN